MKLHEYMENYRVFEHDRKVGLKNIKTGKEVIPAENSAIHAVCPYYADQILLLKVKRDQKYYLYDTDGTCLTKGMEYIGDYNYGIARFLQGKKWGFFDKDGEIFIPPKYEKAERVEFGKYKVRLDNKWGVVDRTGEIVKPQYEGVYAFTEKIYGKTADKKYIRLLI